MNSREIELLKNRQDVLKALIKEEESLPKMFRNNKALAEAKKKMDIISSWIKPEKRKKKHLSPLKLTTKKEMDQIMQVVSAQAPVHEEELTKEFIDNNLEEIARSNKNYKMSKEVMAYLLPKLEAYWAQYKRKFV